MKIALFGGTFNPIHQGHLDIIEDLSNEFDEVWVIPSYITVGKTIEIDLLHRERMINHAVKKFKNVVVNKIEIEKRSKSYTYLTIQEITDNNPNIDFTFVFGFDNVKSFDKWEYCEDISNRVKLKAYFRNKRGTHPNVSKFNIELAEIIPTPISSTSIRSGHAINTFDNETRNLFLQNKVYVKGVVKSLLSKETYIHSLQVAELSEQLAIIHNVYPLYAYIAGIFHDITKEMSLEESEEILERLSLRDIQRPVMHQYTAPYVLETEFGFIDKDVLSSIRKHTTADLKMNRFEKIIYIADKANVGRDKENPEAKSIRELAKTNLNDAFVECIKWSNDRLRAKGIELSEAAKKIENKWSKK